MDKKKQDKPDRVTYILTLGCWKLLYQKRYEQRQAPKPRLVQKKQAQAFPELAKVM